MKNQINNKEHQNEEKIEKKGVFGDHKRRRTSEMLLSHQTSEWAFDWLSWASVQKGQTMQTNMMLTVAHKPRRDSVFLVMALKNEANTI